MIDYDQVFSSFIGGSGEGSAIKDIYNIIPSLTPERIKVLNTLRYYSVKWCLTSLNDFLDSYMLSVKENKELNFLSTTNMKNLLKAYTQDDLIRGVKVNSQISQGNGGV